MIFFKRKLSWKLLGQKGWISQQWLILQEVRMSSQSTRSECLCLCMLQIPTDDLHFLRSLQRGYHLSSISFRGWRFCLLAWFVSWITFWRGMYAWLWQKHICHLLIAATAALKKQGFLLSNWQSHIFRLHIAALLHRNSRNSFSRSDEVTFSATTLRPLLSRNSRISFSRHV